VIRKALVLATALTVYLLSHKSWFALLSISLGILLCFEEVLRIKFWRFSTNNSVGHLRSRLSFLPYSEGSYNADLLKCFPKNKHSAREILFHEKANFTSTQLNFTNGLRKTSFTESIKNPKNRVFIFGGSTIDCLEVPDDYTIASRLQNLFNSSATTNLPEINLREFEVINCGVAGATVRANFEHFQHLNFGAGDICIFYFGINETNFGEQFWTFKAPLQKIPGIEKLRNRKLNLISLNMLTRLLSTFDPNATIFDEKVSIVNQIFTSLERSCMRDGVKFLAVLQPFINTRSPISPHDKWAFFHYWPKSHFNPHSLLFERFANEFKTRKFFVDGRTFFDGIDLDVYTEWCHTNFLGNQIIAENFFQIIAACFSKK